MQLKMCFSLNCNFRLSRTIKRKFRKCNFPPIKNQLSAAFNKPTLFIPACFIIKMFSYTFTKLYKKHCFTFCP